MIPVEGGSEATFPREVNGVSSVSETDRLGEGRRSSGESDSTSGTGGESAVSTIGLSVRYSEDVA